MKLYDYICNICNFLNNTSGCICDNEIKFLIELFKEETYSYSEIFSKITIEDRKKLDADIECDRQNDFYEDLYFLSKKIN